MVESREWPLGGEWSTPGAPCVATNTHDGPRVCKRGPEVHGLPAHTYVFRLCPHVRARPIRELLAMPGTLRNRTAIAAFAILVSACAGGPAPTPEPGASRGTPPDLRGLKVIVLPFQQNAGVRGNPDAELAFGLQSRSPDVEWILPDEMDAALARSPGVRTRTRGLSVGIFLQAEVDRIGDPLYGEIRRMAALVDADVVLIPIGIAPSAAETVGGDPAVAVTAALVGTRTGRVAWFGIVEGEAQPAGDPRGLASAIDQLARTLLWYVGEPLSQGAEHDR